MNGIAEGYSKNVIAGTITFEEVQQKVEEKIMEPMGSYLGPGNSYTWQPYTGLEALYILEKVKENSWEGLLH